MRFCTSTICILILWSLGFTQGDVRKTDLQKIAGAWKCISREDAGKKASAEEMAKHNEIITFKDDQWSCTINDKDAGNGTVSLDSTKKPILIDIQFKDGPKLIGICEITGDTMRICLTSSKESRPTEFKTTDGDQLFLTVYVRAKK